ncbi:MAG: CHAT domain-containing protein, partial [Chloroflexota bacterium]
MDIEAMVQSIVQGDLLTSFLNAAFADGAVEHPVELADRLKAEADRHWRIDPNISLRCADAIVTLGEGSHNARITALGLMARGDALKLLDQSQAAWQTLDDAGELFQSSGDPVGWARTRVGKLAIAVELNQVSVALREAELARDIFRAHHELEKLLRLELNLGSMLNYLGDYRSALTKYTETLDLARTLGEAGQARLNIIHLNMGYAYQGLGNLIDANACYERSRDLMVTQGEAVGVALADLNIASVAQAQGHYKKALSLLHTMSDVLARFQPTEVPRAMRDMIECYLFLNRFSDARDLARRLIDQHLGGRKDYDLALTLLQIAVAETSLGDFDAAYNALRQSEQLLRDQNATGWLGVAYLRWAQAALKQGDLVTAYQQAEQAVGQFSSSEQQIYYAAARLVEGQIALQENRAQAAHRSALEVQRIARQWNIPGLDYGAHLLLGRAAESSGHPSSALHHFQTAAHIIEDVQRSLTLHFRSDFLEDKQDAVRSLLRLHLSEGRVEAAFGALERAKAQVWLSYLSQRDQLRWFRDDPATSPFIDELERLRQEHHWFYRVAYDQSFREQQHAAIAPEQAAAEAATREREIRRLTERLYLNSEAQDRLTVPLVQLADMQHRLVADSAMLAYYSDGSTIWAFLVNDQSVELFPLGSIAPAVDRLIAKMQSNFDRALRIDVHAPDARVLEQYARHIGGQLYELLVKPFADRLTSVQRLIVVPYGSLHYLAFHTLHDSQRYWVEQQEIVVLPAASLITQPAPQRQRGALALSNSWDGRLEHTAQEAERIVQRFGGDLYPETLASRDRLDAAPRQILHLSVHGKHRMDQPDFSYLQLADGPLYTDDLFQHDLSYELVTLSACETGRSRIAAGDEPVGLGRGFLFAGAGALLASLWRVDDALTLEFMEEFYSSLDAGASKAAAMREAQLSLLRATPGLHPAYWGAFELIGNPAPL